MDSICLPIQTVTRKYQLCIRVVACVPQFNYHKNLKSFYFCQKKPLKPTHQVKWSIPNIPRYFLETKDEGVFFSMNVFIYQTHYLCHFFFRGGTTVHPSGSCSS